MIWYLTFSMVLKVAFISSRTAEKVVIEASQSSARVIFRHLLTTSLKAFMKVTYNWRLEGTRTSSCSKLLSTVST